ncbi:asparagine synthase (glutamine-hydrolyzing) [Acetivibrio clariflavus]|uniref:asparagine synthase (glutamine-hydrolyzing) n=1 Tax=Acetivibrio clariflavus (strain DSM 19732 / NBRC 101661 / EBR45) TaxID=720554 RepID=G8M1D9_ACECE|nr:asparagine synthase (glutamine-hydrolyzing) [Acetivibrio clariflavus]AEV69154.1 asparagine synthase, glutamine-hydrolyzing [Acetivibrio clariflavus DSM 19732]
MCGIAGWINLKEDLHMKKDIMNEMIDTLVNRGPDASGTWCSNHVLLGHRRLIVVDPAGGSQPMARKYGENEYVITYNGELYNTQDLRKELEAKGHVFNSHSDTEVLLVSYIEWGPECVEHLNGIYAFGVWSEKDQSLFIARDRFGVKPLFYTLTGDSFLFASEIKALLANPLVKREVGPDGLAEIFALGPARTPGHGVFKNISEVKPAHFIIYDQNGLREKRYWKLESKPHTDSVDQTVEKVRNLVLDAINRQLVADVPVCTFLSGGLDSSIISAVTAKAFMADGNKQLHTFSVDYIDNDIYFKPSLFQPNPDAPWVKRLSEEIKSCHHYIKLDTPQIVSALTDAVKAKDLPGMSDIDSSLLLFCKEVKKEAVVALSGECADEIFGGYPWFYNDEMLNADTFPWARSVKERSSILSPDIAQEINCENYVKHRYLDTLADVPQLSGETESEKRRREIMYLNIVWFMATLLDRKDRMSMATGLEVRVPFCDHRIVEYLWNIPWEIKYLDQREKGLLRRAFKGILPNDVLYRKKSPYPKTHNPAYLKAVKEWLQNILNDPSSPLLGIINRKRVQEILDTDGTAFGVPWFGQLMTGPQLFAYLIQVDIWLREYKVALV